MGWLKRFRRRRRDKTPLRKRHIRLAEKTAERAKKLLKDLPAGTANQNTWVRAKLKAAGYKYSNRPDLSPHHNRFTMTLRRVIRLCAGWSDYSLPKQVRILVHELVHAVLQRKKWTHTVFESLFAWAHWRWAIEAPAYLATALVYKKQGKSDKWIKDWIERIIDSVYDSYALGRIQRRSYEVEFRKILRMALD